MRVIVAANGVMHSHFTLEGDDVLIAADGGLRHCLDLGLQPAIVIGDLDSIDEGDLDTLEPSDTQILRYPTQKDFTDLELALQHALKLGADEIVIVAALGARWDQTISNLLLPASFPSVKIHLMDGSQEIHYVRAGEKLEIHGRPGDLVSLIPLADNARGVTTEHLEYPLRGGELTFGSTRGISNVLLEETGTISINSGLLLCIVIHQ
ncbi:thiamine diphosphokinase [Chloroflexota bacterium]